jgi:hypothetical protein
MKKQLSVFVALFALMGMIFAAPSQIFAQEPEVTTTSSPIDVKADDIQRGNTQTINIKTESPADIIGKVTYPSGHAVIFQGTTDESGALDYSWKVGPNTKPGTASVDVLASTDQGRATGSTTFEIVPKGALIPPPGEPAPPIQENTTTAPEEPIVIAPENETSTVTPDNATQGGIQIPINDTSIVIPSNETTFPEPVQNDTEVIIGPSNETEIVTGDNASQVPEIPDEALPINDTEIIIPGNETTVGENTTVSEPSIPDITPIDNATNAGNLTDVIVVPPTAETPSNITESELPPLNVTEEFPANETMAPPAIDGNLTAPTQLPIPPSEPEPAIPPSNITVTEPGNVTAVPPSENVTIESPTNGNVSIETPGTNITVTEPSVPPAVNVSTPDEAIDLVENQTEVLDQAVESGNVDEIIKAMQQAIRDQQAIIAIVQTATDEERDRAEEAVNNMNEVISEAFSEVSE